jgi:hypothetical protein
LEAYRVDVPLIVGAPGALAGVAALALEDNVGRLTVEVLSHSGISVSVRGVQGASAKAVVTALSLILELLGEEAQLRVTVNVDGPAFSLAASLAGAAVRAASKILGVEPTISDVASVLLRASAMAAGKPMAPHTAASYLGLPAIGVEQPPLMAAIPGPIDAEVYIIEPCKAPELPGIAVSADKYVQLVQAATMLPVLLAEKGWVEDAFRLLQAESPWDYAAPEPYRRARKVVTETGNAAGLDPYTGVFVVLTKPGDGEVASRAAAAVSSAYNCRVKTYKSRPRKPSWGVYPA